MYCFVMDNRGILLSPTKVQKAWYFIRKGKAKLINKDPMCIQLFRSQNNTDSSRIKLGIDPGDTSGVALVQECLYEENNKVIFKGEILHRKDVSKRVQDRASYRRLRRSEKRYRPARFNNRASSMRKGRIAPSIRSRKDEIIRLVKKLTSWIVIHSIHIEDASFDVRALTEGYKPYSWQYQTSNRLDENIRKAVILRDKCSCQMCGVSNTILQAHHITPRREGGSDSIYNLITLCSFCHSKVTNNEDSYKQIFYSKIGGKALYTKPAMYVMQGKTYLYSELNKLCSSVVLTTGGDTSNKRIDWCIEKTHTNDAVVITGVRVYQNKLNTYVYQIKPQRKKSQTKQKVTSAIKHRDLVWYKPRNRQSIKCYVTAILQTGSCAGKYRIKSLDGERFGPISGSSLTLISQGNSGILFA